MIWIFCDGISHACGRYSCGLYALSKNSHFCYADVFFLSAAHRPENRQWVLRNNLYDTKNRENCKFIEKTMPMTPYSSDFHQAHVHLKSTYFSVFIMIYQWQYVVMPRGNMMVKIKQKQKEQIKKITVNSQKKRNHGTDLIWIHV